jgi:hypothetical protein
LTLRKHLSGRGGDPARSQVARPLARKPAQV